MTACEDEDRNCEVSITISFLQMWWLDLLMMCMKDVKKIQTVHVVLQLMLMLVWKSSYKSDSHPAQEMPQVRTIYHTKKCMEGNFIHTYVTVGEKETEM